MTSYASMERAELAAALRAVPSDAPTLCEGWTAHDLAAHLVARERRPDSLPGLMVPALAGWTDRVRRGHARRPYPELIALIASGPPLTSPFRLPGVDEAVNLGEFLIHTEDVRRAAPGWRPRDLAPALQDRIWSSVRAQGRLTLRGAPVTVRLARPGSSDEPVTVGGHGPAVTLIGEPLELLLYCSGRRDHARVEPTGAPEAVEALRRMRLHL